MSHNSLVALVNSINTKWKNNVVNSRPNEQAQLQAHLGGDATFSTVTNQIEEWSVNLRNLAGKPRVSKSISKSLIQATKQCFSSISNALDYAGNGVDWICVNRNFAVNYSLAILLVRELTSESGRESAAIVDAAKLRLENDLTCLQTGSNLAKTLIDKQADIDEHIETIEQGAQTVDEKLETLTIKVAQVNETIDDALSDATGKAIAQKSALAESMTEFASTLAESKDTLAEALHIKEDAEALIGSAKKAEAESSFKYAKAIEALDLATEKQLATNGRLSEALRNAQMEGLAGSFTRMAEKTEGEIATEQKKFESALVYLVCIGVIGLVLEFSLGFPKSSEEFTFRLIRTLSLAAPGIWVAWFAAKRLSALNRVFSDYQYKSASALAYESYRQTVADAGDDELKKQLLTFAIRAFGENPTRYYDSAQNDAASPGESWLSKLLPSVKQTSEK